jgi:uncharacterized protein (TIGR03084 family)
VDAICNDLAAEHDALDALVAPLTSSLWDRPTPSIGWTIRDQVSHLWYFDRTATLALTDADAFEASKRVVLGDPSGDPSSSIGRAMSAPDLLQAWRADRANLLAALRVVDPSARVPWYGPSMAARSFATARLMETWAHGQDVADTLGVTRVATDRLRHVAHIGVRARAFSYAANAMPMPTVDIRVELDGPHGDRWTWGDEASAHRVTGPALDFCLVVTQRRHVTDTALVAEGEAAREWLSIAQAFAGPPGAGRAAGQFTR